MILHVPGDKSLTQRALIFAALAEGESRLSGLLAAGDPRSTAAVLRALGAGVPEPPADGSEIRIVGSGLRGLSAPTGSLDFENSGTGARLMLGVLAGQHLTAEVTGDASLRSRPMGRVTEPLTLMGAQFEALGEEGRLPLRVRGGPLRPLVYDSPVASAQVKSALLLAGLVGGQTVTVSEPRRSRDHTERMLASSGAQIESRDVEGRWSVALTHAPDVLPPLDFAVPGDPSSAAFVLALGALGVGRAPLEVGPVALNPTRTGFLPVLERMGVGLEVEPAAGELPWEPIGAVRVLGCEPLRATEVTAAEVPALLDEIPVIAMLAARADGVTRITGAGELRVKESDRIRALVENLRAVGVGVEELEDGLEIAGTDRPLRGSVRSFHDHRIAMAFGVLGAQEGNEIVVEDPETADVSFPGFWQLVQEVARSRARTPPARGQAVTEAGGPIVTLDGPAGSGKSTTSKAVAERLGFRHLDSGALYRAVTHGLLRAGIEPARWERLDVTDLDALGIRVEPVGRKVVIRLGGHRLGRELRTDAVTEAVSNVARLPGVREWLLGVQRQLGSHGSLVAEGRDMGTVVFPDAEVKIYLVADLEERARRRLIQVGNEAPTQEEITAEAARIEDRDRIDSERELSPLRRPDDAFDLDTTGSTFDEQVSAIVQLVRGDEVDPVTRPG